MARFFVAVVVSLHLFLVGCVSSPPQKVAYVSTVDALAVPNAPTQRRFVIRSGVPNVSESDLEFGEYAAMLDRALVKQGFVRAAGLSDANIVVVLNYGISAPAERQYTMSVPQWGQTGYAGSSTTGSVNSFGSVTPWGNSASYAGTTTYQQQTQYTPTYGVTGYQTVSGTVVTYTRGMTVRAVPAGQWGSGNPSESWRTTVTSVGSSGNLRLVFPYMVTAAMPHLGTRGGGKPVEVLVPEDDANALFIRDGVQPAGAPKR